LDIVVLGIDLGKNSCSLVGLDASGRIVLRRRMRRGSVESFVGGLEPCIIAMEACCGAHHLGRILTARGHAVRLMSPEYVRPYVKAQKNDELDAEAIAEDLARAGSQNLILARGPVRHDPPLPDQARRSRHRNGQADQGGPADRIPLPGRLRDARQLNRQAAAVTDGAVAPDRTLRPNLKPRPPASPTPPKTVPRSRSLAATPVVLMNDPG
jgi:hypothetical protein